MISIVILTAFITAIAIYIDKLLVNKGISRKDYFYYMCFSMVPFSIVMIFIDSYRNGGIHFELNFIPFIILVIAMFLRYTKQHTIVGCLTHLNPYESTIYMSLGIIIAFIIDCIIGTQQFTIINILSIILTLTGVFILASVKLSIKSLRKDLAIRIACEVALGYVAHYILKYWDNAIYLLILNFLLTIIFSKGYNLEYHKKNKNIIKWVFIQQTFGFMSVYLENYISATSVTLTQYVRPVTIVMAILIAFLTKNSEKRPKIKDVVSVLLVVLGIGLLSL